MTTQADTGTSPTVARLLALLAFTAVLPMLAFAAFLIWRNSQAERESYLLQLQATTRAISAAIDGQIRQELDILETLRATRSLRNHEWSAFYDTARTAIEDEPGTRIAVLEPSGQAVLSTLVPYGTSLPMSAAPDVIRQVAKSKRAYVSDLFVGALSKTYVLYSYLPTIENGATAYVLALGITPAQISALLRGSELPQGIDAVVADRTGAIIARTLNEEQLRGQKVVPELLVLLRQSQEGEFEGRAHEGTPVRGYFIKSTLTGWMTAVAADQAAFNAPLWRSLTQLGGGGALLLLLSLLLSTYSARRISAPIASLAAMADSLGRGEVPPLQRLALREAEAIAGRMRLAAEALKRLNAEREDLFASLERRVEERTREVAAGEARYRSLAAYARSLLEASPDPLVTISPEGKVTDVNKATEDATGHSRMQLIGTDFAGYFTEPEKAQAAYREAFAEGQIADLPLELRHRSGAVMDVLYNASVYRDENGAVAGVFAAARNVTARKRAEEARARASRALAMVNACNNVVIHATHEDQLLEDVCRTIVEAGGYKLAWVGYARDDPEKSVRPIAYAGSDSDYVEHVNASWADNERGRGPTGTAIRAGRVVVARDIGTDPNFVPWRRRAAEKGYRSSATMPLKVDNETYGALMAYSGEPDAFDAEEIRLLVELADDLAYATAALRTRAARAAAEAELSRHRENLEALVKSRTAELTRSNEQLANANEALRESEDRFNALASNTLDHLLVQDRELRYRLVVNPQLGLTQADMIGKRDADFLSREDAEKLTALKRQVLETGKPLPVETSLKSRNGGDEFFAGAYLPKLNKKGEIDGLIGYFQNVTERKRNEESIRKLNEVLSERAAELESANKELEAFSYSVSHDLQAPLRAINGFSEILLEEYAGKLDAEGQRLLNVVRDAATKMGRLIDDILSFSRAGRMEMSFARVDMKALAEAALRELGIGAGERNPRIEIGRLPEAFGDGPMLQRVWANLLDNAAKFTGSKPDPAIEVGAESNEREDVYYVKDNGVGFDMQYVDKLFGVFQRLHGPEEFPGTGIGLAIVKRIVTRHGGRVWAEGKPGEGAVFRFALPRQGGTANA